MNTILYVMVVSLVLVPFDLVYHQVFAQQQDIVDQGDVRQFLELGEEKYREECNKDIPNN